MPTQTVPSNDLIPDYLNKPGRFFNADLKTKWFAEYATALHGRLVAGTFSVNCYDLWVGGDQIIDSFGLMTPSHLDASVGIDGDFLIIGGGTFETAPLSGHAIVLQIPFPGTPQVGNAAIDGDFQAGGLIQAISYQPEAKDAPGTFTGALEYSFTDAPGFHFFGDVGYDFTVGPWDTLWAQQFHAKKTGVATGFAVQVENDTDVDAATIEYSGRVSSRSFMQAEQGYVVGPFTQFNRPRLAVDTSGATVGGLALENFNDPGVDPYVPILCGGMLISDDPETLDPYEVVDTVGRIYVQGREGLDLGGFAPRFELNDGLLPGQIMVFDTSLGVSGESARFVAGGLDLIAPDLLTATPFADWDATLTDGVLKAHALRITSPSSIRVLDVGGRESTSLIAPGTAAAAFPEAGATGFYIDTTNSEIHLVFNWDGVNRYSVQLTPIT